MKLGTIKEEAAACRKAFKGIKIGTPIHCLHHDSHYEVLTESASARIRYILAHKPVEEQTTRLRHLRPVVPRKYWSKACREAYPERDKAFAAWEKALGEWMKSYRAERDNAEAEWDNACAVWGKVWTAWIKSYMKSGLHARDFPDCKWNGKTILQEEVR